MVQLTSDACLAHEPRTSVLSMGIVGVQHLDRDRALEADLVAAKDLAHGAVAKGPLDAVLARDDVADLQGPQYTTFGDRTTGRSPPQWGA